MSGSTGSKLANLPTAATLGGNELLYLVQNGQDVKATAASFANQVGGALPLTGGTLTGTLGSNISGAWSGAWPGTNNLGFNVTHALTGTPTGSFTADILGNSLPLNLLYSSSDQLARSAGIVSVLEISQLFGGGATAGGRSALVVNQQIVGAQAASPYPFNALTTQAQGIGANVTGATSGSGNGIGAYYLYGGYYGRMYNNVHVHELNYAEIDFGTPGASMLGSTADYLYGLKFVNMAPAAWGNAGHAYVYECFLNFSTGDPATMAQLNHIIVFGDPQSTGGGFPGSPTGDLITSFAGTTKNAIDFSALTCTNLLKGPNGFAIGGNNHIASDQINAVGANSFAVGNTQGNPMLVLQSTGNAPASYLYSNAGATVTVDTGGTAASLQVGPLLATGVVIGRSAITTQILGTPLLGSGSALATNATSGMPKIPTCAGAPTGTIGAAGQAAMIYDSTDSKLYISVGGGTWKSATFA